MRYVVAPVTRPLGGRTGFYRIVGIGDGNLLTEPEARIIVFALNAVADNMTLQAWPNTPTAPNSREYTGPTEGVRQ